MRRRIPLTPEQLALPSLDTVLDAYVLQVVEACGGNRVKAARVLQIDRKTLYRMLARLMPGLGEANAEPRTKPPTTM